MSLLNLTNDETVKAVALFGAIISLKEKSATIYDWDYVTDMAKVYEDYLLGIKREKN